MTTEQLKNPLSKYYRKAGMSIPLPSLGHWYENGDIIQLNAAKEVDIYPMTAADESILKNPDALMNGRAIEQLLSSCVPQIQNLNAMLSPDIDTLILAIRCISLGEDLDINTKCPSCDAEQTFTIKLQTSIQNMKLIEPPYSVKLEKDLEVYVRPYNFKNQITVTTAAFEESKKVQNLRRQKNYSASKETELINAAYNRLNDLKFNFNIEAIDGIIIEKEQVTDKQLISEFLQSADGKYYRLIDGKIDEMNTSGIKKTHNAVCTSCGHEWEASLETNPASFFG